MTLRKRREKLSSMGTASAPLSAEPPMEISARRMEA